MSSMSSGAADGGLQAVYYVHQMELPDVLQRLEPFVSGEDVQRSGRYFSAWGQHMSPQASHRPCAHYLAPLDSSFRRAFVLRSAIPLPVCPGLSAVLGTMLSRMGEGSEIHVQSSRTRNPVAQWVTPEYLSETLPAAAVEDEPGGVRGWIRLGWGPGLERDLARLGSAYPRLAHRFDELKQVLIEAGHPNKGPEEAYYDSAENAFIYSQHWALESGGIIDRIFRRFGMTDPMRGLDIGGSYGFLACELAAQGHSMTNLELIDWRVEKVQPWLAEASGVADRVSGVAERMETLTGEEASYDFVCFMGSLLCCDRAQVPDVLQRTMRLLKPGGLAIVRENLLIDETKGKGGATETRFTPQELQEALKGHASTPAYFCHLGLEWPFEEVRKRWMIYAVSRKPEAPAGRMPQAAAERAGAGFLRRLVSG